MQDDNQQQLQEIKEENPYGDQNQQEKQSCILCETEMTEHEQKVSMRLYRYSKDRGETLKLLSRLKQRLILKQQNEDKQLPFDPLSINEKDSNQEIPLVCFKCQYEMLLGNEGRAKAMRIFQIAQQELCSNPSNSTRKNIVKSLQPIKNRYAHENSQEMHALGFLTGTFYDYNKSSAQQMPDLYQPSSNNTSPHLNHSYQSLPRNTTNPLLLKQRQQQQQHSLISIARENGLNSLDSQLVTPSQLTGSSSKIVKPWREDFQDKVMRKFGSLNNQERQQKILYKIEKERNKFNMGQRIFEENKRIKRIGFDEANFKEPKQKHAFYNTSELQFSVIINFQQFRVLGSHKKIDKTFFRKLSNFGAFANASFNAGVFINPPQDYA